MDTHPNTAFIRRANPSNSRSESSSSASYCSSRTSLCLILVSLIIIVPLYTSFFFSHFDPVKERTLKYRESDICPPCPTCTKCTASTQRIEQIQAADITETKTSTKTTSPSSSSHQTADLASITTSIGNLQPSFKSNIHEYTLDVNIHQSLIYLQIQLISDSYVTLSLATGGHLHVVPQMDFAMMHHMADLPAEPEHEAESAAHKQDSVPVSSAINHKLYPRPPPNNKKNLTNIWPYMLPVKDDFWSTTNHLQQVGALTSPTSSYRQYSLQLSKGMNTVRIELRSQDHTITTTYTITIRRGNPPTIMKFWPTPQQQILLDRAERAFDHIRYQFRREDFTRCHSSENNHAVIQIYKQQIYLWPKKVLADGNFYRVWDTISFLYTMMDINGHLVPDTIFLLDQDDTPGTDATKRRCPPLFAYTSDLFWDKNVAIPIPCFSFQGHGSHFGPWHRTRRSFYSTSRAKPPIARRNKQLFFRGVNVGTGRQQFITQMAAAGHNFTGSQGEKYVSLRQQCVTYRYQFYAGGHRSGSWSTRLKYQLLCGVPVFADRILGQNFAEFWYPLLLPYQHYIPTTPQTLLQQYELAEQHLDWADEIGRQARDLIWTQLTPELVYEYFARLMHTFNQHIVRDSLIAPKAEDGWVVYPRGRMMLHENSKDLEPPTFS